MFDKSRSLLNCSLFLILIFLAEHAFAQQDTGVHGSLSDASDHAPISQATVSLSTKAGKRVGTVLSDRQGHFVFKLAIDTSYTIEVSAMGYSKVTRKVELGAMRILMHIQQTTLTEVKISAPRPIVRQEIDKTVYRVLLDEDRKTSNLMDIIPKVPYLSLGADDNLLLKGSTNFRILVDGRPSPIADQNPRQFLRNLSALNVKDIEVYTTPPARFEGEGLGGIINIVTQKKVIDGYNGNAGANIGRLYNGTHGSINLKSGKLGLASSLSQTHSGLPISDIAFTRRGSEDDLLRQIGHRRGYDNSIYASAFVGYEIDSLNLLTLNATLSDGNNRYRNNQQVSISGNDALSNQSYSTDLLSTYDRLSYNMNFNYQLGFAKKPGKLLTFSYQGANSKGTTENTNRFYSQQQSDFDDYGQFNRTHFRENNVQVDFVGKLKNIDTELGVKYIHRSNSSDFSTQILDEQSGSVNDNGGGYDLAIASAYNSYTLKYKSWGFKAGIRLEHTDISAAFTSASFGQDYLNLLPTLILQKKLDADNSLRLSYTNRIQRPDISLLNPFVNISDPRVQVFGNPNLRPVRNNKLDLEYTYFKKLNLIVGASYIFSNNAIQTLTQLGTDSISRTTYGNVGSREQLTLTTDFSKSLGKKMRMKLTGTVSQIRLRGQVGATMFENSGIEGHAYAYLFYNLGQGWQTTANAGYAGQTVRLQGSQGGYFYNSFGVSKTFLKDKLYSRLVVANPFQNSVDIENSLSGDTFRQSLINQRIIRDVNLSLVFEFGKMRQSIKKNRRSINNDDKVSEP